MNTTKKKIHLIPKTTLLLGAALWMAACSSDELDPQAGYGNTISLTTSFDGMRGAGNLQTTQLNSSVKVGVFGMAGSTALTNGKNSPYSVSGTALSADEAEMEWPSKGSIGIYAYTPYQPGWAYNTPNDFAVAQDQSTDTGYLDSDLTYGVPTSNPVAQTEDAVTLNFRHLMARLKIIIQNETDIDISNAKVMVSNTKIATTFNPSTGAIGGPTGDAADITALATLGTGTTAYVALVPQTIAAGTVFVQLVSDERTFQVKLTQAVSLVSGKSYTLTVKIGSDDINSDLHDEDASMPAQSREF
ncbi:MAG: fimbrillin family protein [Prevotella sp.]|nr:fimbrillin family protein [Prevotella sp.]